MFEFTIPDLGVRRTQEILIWCTQHYGRPMDTYGNNGNWRIRMVDDKMHLTFSREADAVLFKLTWL